MNRGKAVFVSALVALLTAGLLASAWQLCPRLFMGAALLLAGYGYLRACGSFCRWLGDRELLLPAASRAVTRPERETRNGPAVERWDWTEEGEA